ncbi:MAG: hypothetical protein IJ828_09690 [Treponema sp.]|nr:hypothetical protein [Treponema sp.]
MKKKCLVSAIIFLIHPLLFAEGVIEFYSTQSASADVEMIGMTTDLYYNQLQNTNGYSVIDKRDTAYNTVTKTKHGISFYAQIEQTPEDEALWTCTLHAIDGKTNKESYIVKNYESYYKILLDAKTSINALLAKLSDSPDSTASSTGSGIKTSIEDLYGTWDAENSVNKIVIMQNRKGFVIYDNGSSMNVSVSIDGSTITVRQLEKSENTAYPTTWKLTKSENGVLKGTRISGDSTTAVEWTKR